MAPKSSVRKIASVVLPRIEENLSKFTEIGGVLEGGRNMKRPFPYVRTDGESGETTVKMGLAIVSVGTEYTINGSRPISLYEAASAFCSNKTSGTELVAYIELLLHLLKPVYIDFVPSFDSSDSDDNIAPYLQLYA